MPYIFAFWQMARLSFWRSMGASIHRVGKGVDRVGIPDAVVFRAQFSDEA